MKPPISTSLKFCLVFFILFSCKFDVEIDEHALDNFYDDFNPPLGLDIDYSYEPIIESEFSIIDTNPDSILAIGNIKYDSVLILEQYGFNYRVEGDDDSLAIQVDFLKEGDTIDFRLLKDSTFTYIAKLELDNTEKYTVCSFISLKCESNPRFKDQCFDGWYNLHNCNGPY